MAGVERLNVAEDVGDGESAFANTAIEVLFVFLGRLVFVESSEVFPAEGVFIPVFFDGLACDAASIDEDAAFGSFKQDAVVAAAGDDHFEAVGELALDGEIVGSVVTIVDGWITIFERHGVFGVSAVDFHGAHALLIEADGPGGDIDVMGAPVGEFSAGILVPPAELVMAAFFGVIDLRSLAEPLVPIEFGRRSGGFEGAADLAAVDADGDLSDFAQESLLHHVDGAGEHALTYENAACGALLRADGKDAVGIFPASVADELVFFEREGQGLLAKDMFSGLEGFDGDFDMPVIDRVDADDVDVFAVENFTVISVGVGFAPADRGMVFGFRGMSGIDVADGQDIAEARMAGGVLHSHAADADQADFWAIVGGIIGKCLRAPGKIGHRNACCGGDG